MLGPRIDGPHLVAGAAEQAGIDGAHRAGTDDRDPHRPHTVRGSPTRERRLLPVYLSGLVPAIQMMTRVNFPSASKEKKLQLCMSFFEPSFNSPM